MKKTLMFLVAFPWGWVGLGLWNLWPEEEARDEEQRVIYVARCCPSWGGQRLSCVDGHGEIVLRP